MSNEFTRDEVIRLAREAGFSGFGDDSPYADRLVRLAMLVDATAHDRIAELERQLAESQAREVALRRSLEKILEIASPYRDGVKFNYIADVAQEALDPAVSEKARELVEAAREKARADYEREHCRHVVPLPGALSAMVDDAVAAEREACAKVCDALRDCDENTDGYRAGAGWCGEAIRARGKP